MDILTVKELIPILHTAIGPTILISGVGLLLLSMTNRLGRVIDRARLLAELDSGINKSECFKTDRQLQVLWKRARLIRLAISLASMSLLSAAILIMLLFYTALWQVETGLIITIVFMVCLGCLVASLIVFIYDINQSLAALKFVLSGEKIPDKQ